MPCWRIVFSHSRRVLHFKAHPPARPPERAACRHFTRRISADVGNAPLILRLSNGLGLRGKREDSCVLSFMEPRQQHDLAKDRNGVDGTGKEESGLVRHWLFEREFGTRKYANRHRTIFRRSKSSRASAEVVCDEFFAHFGWAGSHGVQTVVAHIKELLSSKPPMVQY